MYSQHKLYNYFYIYQKGGGKIFIIINDYI